jgi:hypothetical protein
MKRDLLTSILALILLASSLAAAAMCYKFLKTAHFTRVLQEQVVKANQDRVRFQSFAVELNEYAVRNPSINPLLDQMGLRLRLVTNNIPAGGTR